MASRSSARALRDRRQQSAGIRALAFPLLLLVGLLLLVPGGWGVCLLSGMDVPMSHREDASAMAVVMLVSLPVALFLFVGAFVMRPGTKR